MQYPFINTLINSVQTEQWGALAWIPLQVGILLLAIVFSWILHGFIIRLLKRIHKQPLKGYVNTLLPNVSNSSQWFITWCSLELVLPLLNIPRLENSSLNRIHHLFYVFIIISAGWLMMNITRASSEWLKQHYNWKNSNDNLKSRSINTQLRVFTHVIVFIIWVITGIAIIMTIPHLRSIGVSLFASAGVAGIVIGMAASPALSNLIAGIQLALTQPIRMDDQIVIEGVSGIVEEIDSTYVVVRLWDFRRLIVPLNYFIQNRFQNWTHSLSNISIANAIINVDLTFPIEPLRKELESIAQQLPAWDKKVCQLLVTNIKDNKMVELQASISTANPGDVYMLQCKIREKLLLFIQRGLAKTT